MKIRILSTISLLILALVTAGSSVVGTREVSARQANRLLSLLPESDAVALIDSRRFFDDALPKALASKPTILSEITAKLDEIQQRSTIDLRKFDQIAVGLKITKLNEKDFDSDPVLIARGNFGPGALIGMAKIGSNGTYREEKIGERTIYIFSVKDIAAKNAVKTGATGVWSGVDSAANKLSGEVAATNIDANTLAIGSVARVRETVEAKTRVATDLLGLLTPYEHSIMSFAVWTPQGLAGFVPMDNDELAKTLGSVRYVAGSMDMAAGAASLQVMIRAAKADDAQGLLDTLQALQGFGKALLGGSKKPEQKVLARVVDNAKIAKAGSDVTVDISIPQSDIDALLAMVK
jgi:hypothetical protein